MCLIRLLNRNIINILYYNLLLYYIFIINYYNLFIPIKILLTIDFKKILLLNVIFDYRNTIKSINLKIMYKIVNLELIFGL